MEAREEMVKGIEEIEPEMTILKTNRNSISITIATKEIMANTRLLTCISKTLSTSQIIFLRTITKTKATVATHINKMPITTILHNITLL